MSQKGGAKFYVVALKSDAMSRYSKRLTLEKIGGWLEVKEYERSYEEYIRPVMLYFTEDLNELAKALSVDRVVPKGLYIMGVYGGEKKKGVESYAGLILENYVLRGGLFEFRLYNTIKVVDVPQSMLKEHGVSVYEMVYVGEIDPFRLRRLIPILLSREGGGKLREFINKVVEIHRKSLPDEDVKKISKLAEEVEQPENIEALKIDRWYAIYRVDRAFTALTFKPTINSTVIHSQVGYLESSDENIAYYYAAVLNYLAYNVIKLKRSFMRHQYGRPLLAIVVAGLAWNNVGDDIRRRVVELSKLLHEKVPCKEYSNQKVALNDISTISEFKELISALDKWVDRDRLKEALKIVSGEETEEA
jgi:hypothetical protein